MHKSLAPFFCTLLFLTAVASFSVAQDKDSWSYEVVSFPDGTTQKAALSYDPFNEGLYLKKDAGEVRYFKAEEVVSFEYRGSRYYSLPFESGAFSFFKVEYEGENSALLSKSNSINLIEYLARRYDKIYTLCEVTEGEEDVRLCRINYSLVGFGPLSLNRVLPASPRPHRLIEKYLEPVYIRECLFVVDEEGIEIFQLDVDQDVLMGLITKDRKYNFESLAGFFGKETYRKMQSYARKNKLKEHQLDDLKMLFQYYDRM